MKSTQGLSSQPHQEEKTKEAKEAYKMDFYQLTCTEPAERPSKTIKRRKLLENEIQNEIDAIISCFLSRNIGTLK